MAKRLVIGESDPFAAGEAVRKVQDPNQPLTPTQKEVLAQALDRYLYQQGSLRTIKKTWGDLDPALNERIRVAEELRKAVG